MRRQRVKSSAFFPHSLRGRWVGFWGLFVLFSAVSAALAQTDTETVRRAPPLILGGAIQAEKSAVRLDPVLPVGRRLGSAFPSLMKNRTCSLKRPVCVVGEGLEESAKQALSWLERAYEEIEFGMTLSSVRASARAPLVWQLEEEQPLSVVEERLSSRGFDRGRARCVGGALTLESARRCLLSAVVVRHAPASARWLRDGFAAETSRELGDAPVASASVAGSFARPQTGVLTASRRATSRNGRPGQAVSRLRSARFFGYLDRRSVGAVGEAGFLSLALAATRTVPGKSRWDAEPDAMDVLAITLQGDRIRVARLYDDFAQDAFFDSRRRGFPMEPDWTIDGASLPRSLAFPQPLEPTGSVYVRLNLPVNLRDEVIGFRTACEAPVSYVWSVARLGEGDQELSRFPLTFRQRGGQASGRVLPQPGVRSLLLVGTNIGGVDLAHPFDPDHGPHEAHGCTATLNVVPDGGASGDPP